MHEKPVQWSERSHLFRCSCAKLIMYCMYKYILNFHKPSRFTLSLFSLDRSILVSFQKSAHILKGRESVSWYQVNILQIPVSLKWDLKEVHWFFVTFLLRCDWLSVCPFSIKRDGSILLRESHETSKTHFLSLNLNRIKFCQRKFIVVKDLRCVSESWENF